MTINPTVIISPMLGQVAGTNIGLSLFLLLLWMGGVFGAIFIIHFLFSLPMRRAERARLFLDLLQGALDRGQSAEEMVLSVAQSRDQTVGVRFHLLAAHIEDGLRFGEALEKVPRLLPPQISAMLHTGEKLGDLKKVLPACREILRERPAGVRSAVHYMLLVVIFFSPVYVGIVMLTTTFVIPRFKDVAAGMGMKIWPMTLFVFGNASRLADLEMVIFAGLVILTIIYLGGPQFALLFPADRIAWGIPWKRKRLERTFSAMLAVLLDGGVPEAVAVRLAGDCTTNEVCQRRAQRIIAALQKGEKLETAVRAFDDSGEFHWRLTNATHVRGGFLNALHGWHETLDAKAFQQEETAAHALTSGIIILNGVLVALIATAMYGILIAILKAVLAAT
ncbi:MAG: type II secretion system F family protein [Limisphaerales bacterium]